MIIHLQKLKNITVALFFIFLFFIFWSAPIQLLSKEFPISDPHILNNFFVLLSIGLSIVLWVILWFTRSKEIALWMIMIVVSIILAATLYSIVLPYRYGYFLDSITLAPSMSLRGYSRWYYLLDVVILSGSFALTYITLKKEILFVPVILIFFYLSSVVMTFIGIRYEDSYVSPSKIITLSKNHENVIVYIPDSLGPAGLVNAITNSDYDFSWISNFTLYDDVVTPSTGGTTVSMPSIIGGKDFAANYQIDLAKNQWDEQTIVQYHQDMGTTTHKSHLFLYRALSNVQKLLESNANVSYYYIHTSLFDQTNGTVLSCLKSPILAVSLYDRLPYFMRWILSKNDGLRWKDKTFFPFKWVVLDDQYHVKVIDTKTATLNYIHSWGTHLSYYPEIVPPTSEENKITNFYAAVDYSFEPIRFLIDKLKKDHIYDSTKIIITPDHGGYYHVDHFTSLNVDPFFLTNYSRYGALDSIPAFLMIKDFNSKTNFSIDSNRTLSGADVHEITVLSLTNIDGYHDYTKVMPMKRKFNVLLIQWPTVVTLLESPQNLGEFMKESNKKVLEVFGNGKELGYFEIESTRKMTNYQRKFQGFDTIKNLPPYEIMN